MRYAQIDTCEIVNGSGVGVSLYVQGCPIHCPGCFNPETWDFNGGQPLTKQEEEIIYQALKPDYITRFSVLGGEPLVYDNLSQLNYILCTVKSNWPNKKIWIWSGYTWDELQQQRKKHTPDKLFLTFNYSDYLVCGPFIQEKKDLTLLWRGSANQQVLDIQKSVLAEKPVLAFE